MAGTRSGPGIALGRLIRLETRKVVDTRSGRWLVIAIGLLTAASLGLVLSVSTPGDELSFQALVGLTSLVQLVLYPVLGILTTTSEFSQRTALVTFAVEPRRHRVVAAKIVAAGLWALVGLAVAVALAAVAHLAAVLWRDAPADWSLGGPMLGGLVLAQLLSVVQGVAFGLLLTSPAAAIVLFFMLPTVWTTVAGLVPVIGRHAAWFDVGRSVDQLLTGAMTGADWAHLTSACGVWVALPLAAGTLLLRRREIA